MSVGNMVLRWVCPWLHLMLTWLLALGGLTYGVSPLDMAAAFSTFANEGVFTEPYAITQITDAQGNVIYTAEPGA